MKINKYEIAFKKPYFLIDEFINTDTVLANTLDKAVNILYKEYNLTESDYTVTSIEEIELFTDTKAPVRPKYNDLLNINWTKEFFFRRHYDT